MQTRISAIVFLGLTSVLLAADPPKSTGPTNQRFMRKAEWVDSSGIAPNDTLFKTFHSAVLGSNVSYLVWLPPGYAATTNRYPVIYWLHGMGGNQQGGAMIFLPHVQDAIKEGVLPPVIVVSVNGMVKSFYCDSSDGKCPMESIIIKDLIPHVDQTYRTIAKREGRVIEGFSMGGYGAGHLGFKYPELFGTVVINAGALLNPDLTTAAKDGPMSGVFGIDNERRVAEYPLTLARKNADKLRGKTHIRIGCGSRDDLLSFNKALHELLTELHIQHDYDIVPDVAHNSQLYYEKLGTKVFEFHRKALSGIQGLRNNSIPQVMALPTDEQRKKVEEIRGQASGAPATQEGRRRFQEPPPKADTANFKPLAELGTGKYKGSQGGHYPDGTNERPPAHEALGVALAKTVQPLDADGKPSRDGKIIVLTVGFSNTTMESQAFKRTAETDPEKNPRVLIVDGAVGMQGRLRIQIPDAPYWATVDDRLKSAGVTRDQVQVAWLKETDAPPRDSFPKFSQTLQAEKANIVRLLAKRFPNLKLVYLSNRTYGGYAKTPLNPEPYAYETGFTVKWLIEQQIKGDPSLNCDAAKGAITAPWLSWGPDLWANGMTKRADGLFYQEKDFVESDGTHPSDFGRKKVADLLLKFFKTDTTTRDWFVAARHP